MMLFSCRTFEAVGHLRPARPLLLLIEVHSPWRRLQRCSGMVVKCVVLYGVLSNLVY